MDLGIRRIFQSIPKMRPDQVKLSTEAKKELHDAFRDFGQAAKRAGSAVENAIMEKLEPPPAEKVEGNGKGKHHEEDSPVNPSA